MGCDKAQWEVGALEGFLVGPNLIDEDWISFHLYSASFFKGFVKLHTIL